MKHILLTFLIAPLLAPQVTLPAGAPPVVCWMFDKARDTETVQPAREWPDSFQGAIEWVPGVRGNGLKFDGFTPRLVPGALDLTQFGPALTVEAWSAPEEYSWTWTGIVAHDQDASAGAPPAVAGRSTSEQPATDSFPLVSEQTVAEIFVASDDWKVVRIAAGDLALDVERVTGRKPVLK